MRKTIALLMAFALAGPAVAQSGNWPITPQGYGPVRIGMTKMQVEAALRVTLEGEAISDPAECVEMVPAGPDQGLYFMFERNRLSRISIGDNSRVRTPRGIGIGASEAQVRRAYRRGLRSQGHQYQAAPARYLTYWTQPSARGVRFETDGQRRVTTIHAGTASIQYVEGCA